MTVEQLRALLLLAIPDQQAEVDRIIIEPVGVLAAIGVYFANGSIDYYDAAGKPVFPT